MFKSTTERIKDTQTVDDLLEIIAELYREKVVSEWDDFVEGDLDEKEFRDFMADLLIGNVENGYQEALAARCAELTDIEDPYDILEAHPGVLIDFDDWWGECHYAIKEDNARAETEAWLSQPWR